ncbi:MAG: MlaD family protein [Bdellovibrionia bacterium]
MQRKLGTEIKVGIFVSSGLVLLMLAVVLLGNTQGLFNSKMRYITRVENSEGLLTGAKVQLGGMPVGTVEKIDFDQQTKKIMVLFNVRKKYEEWIRKDSSIEIATQGILGDKYLSITPGTEQEAMLPDRGEIHIKQSKDLSQFLSKGDQLMLSLNRIASNLDRILSHFETENRSEIFFKNMTKTSTNLAQATQKLNEQIGSIEVKRISTQLAEITEKINNGTGTLGALVNDSALYDEVKALMGGVNRNRVVRNLVRQTLLENEDGTPEPPKK